MLTLRKLTGPWPWSLGIDVPGARFVELGHASFRTKREAAACLAQLLAAADWSAETLRCVPHPPWWAPQWDAATEAAVQAILAETPEARAWRAQVARGPLAPR